MKIRLPLLLATCAFVSITIAAQAPQPTPEKFAWIPDPPSSESRVQKRGPVATAPEDQLKYATFLSQSGTGLVRLLPRWVMTNIAVVPQDNPRAFGINGGGAYFSFYYRTHEYGRGSDLELSRRALGPALRSDDDHDPLRPPGEGLPSVGEFSVGFAGADYGMLTNLGNVPVESINLDDASLAFLLNYRPPRPEPQARCEFRRFHTGVQADGRVYKSRLPIKTGDTFLLRSIVYDTYDVLVAFQVVRQESDGSVTIAWKLLKKFGRTNLEQVRNLNQAALQCPVAN
jgi:hypothetical protein